MFNQDVRAVLVTSRVCPERRLCGHSHSACQNSEPEALLTRMYRRHSFVFAHTRSQRCAFQLEESQAASFALHGGRDQYKVLATRDQPTGHLPILRHLRLHRLLDRHAICSCCLLGTGAHSPIANLPSSPHWTTIGWKTRSSPMQRWSVLF